MMLLMMIITLSHVICLSLHQSAADIIKPSLLRDLPASSSPSPPSSWPGHLQPLGSATTRLPVSELDEFPSPTEFFRGYVYPSVPVVFRRGAKRSPAFEKWSDEYLKSLPGSQDMIDVELRKVENRTAPTGRMPFVEFLDRYLTYDEYLVTGVPEFLKQDVLVPPSLHCDNITEHFIDAVMWFSSGGTKSVLHNDDVDNLNCLFSGQKEILFANYTKYRHQIVFDHPEGSYSSVDVERVDFNKYPEFRDVEFFEAKLEAGDCIYIPYKWYHQVNSIDRNIAINIWWNHKANIVPTPVTCGSPDPGLSLADVKFYFHETENFDQEEIPPELALLDNPAQSLISFMDEEGKKSLTNDQLLGFLSEKMPTLHGGIWNEEALELGHEIFQIIDADKNGKITSQDIEMFPDEEEDEMFGLHLQQNLMMLIDVIDEEIIKKREKLLKNVEENKTTGKSNTSPSQDHHSGTENVEELSLADKDEL